MATTNVSKKLRRLRLVQYWVFSVILVILWRAGVSMLFFLMGADGFSKATLLTPVLLMQLYQYAAESVGVEVGRRVLLNWGVAAMLPFIISAALSLRFRKCIFLFAVLWLLDAFWMPLYFPDTFSFYMSSRLFSAVLLILGGVATLRYKKVLTAASLEDRVNSNVDRRYIVYDSAPIRKAGADNMPAILKVDVFGKQIAYRRRKDSYELVVDGELYDSAEVPEGKPHRLMVNLDGNRYRLRCRRNGHCILTGNRIPLAAAKLNNAK